MENQANKPNDNVEHKQNRPNNTTEAALAEVHDFRQQSGKFSPGKTEANRISLDNVFGTPHIDSRIQIGDITKTQENWSGRFQNGTKTTERNSQTGESNMRIQGQWKGEEFGKRHEDKNGSWEWAKDDKGNTSRTESRNGQTVTDTWDKNGRLTSNTVQDKSGTQKVEYNEDNSRREISKHNNTGDSYTKEFDKDSNLTSQMLVRGNGDQSYFEKNGDRQITMDYDHKTKLTQTMTSDKKNGTRDIRITNEQDHAIERQHFDKNGSRIERDLPNRKPNPIGSFLGNLPEIDNRKTEIRTTNENTRETLTRYRLYKAGTEQGEQMEEKLFNKNFSEAERDALVKTADKTPKSGMKDLNDFVDREMVDRANNQVKSLDPADMAESVSKYLSNGGAAIETVGHAGKVFTHVATGVARIAAVGSGLGFISTGMGFDKADKQFSYGDFKGGLETTLTTMASAAAGLYFAPLGPGVSFVYDHAKNVLQNPGSAGKSEQMRQEREQIRRDEYLKNREAQDKNTKFLMQKFSGG